MKNLNKETLKYPRPLLRRESFIDLNGEWNFFFEVEDVGHREPRYKVFPEKHLKINVPFCYQSELSGINIQDRYDEVWYQREAHFNRKEDERVIFHIGASDYVTYVYVNSKLVGKHKGGYTAFSFDITDYLINNTANIVIRCVDTYDIHQPRGKQKWKKENFGCWYQEVTGIWKSVWAEIVKETYITDIKLTPNRDSAVDIEIHVNNEKYVGSCNVLGLFDNRKVAETTISFNNGIGVAQLPLKEIHYWDLTNPSLYDLLFNLDSGDIVQSQFGYRFVSTKDGKILLNDSPIFMRLTLEQGYYKEGIYTFKDIDQMIDEIKLIRNSGFNGLRMHQKVEDERFYYLCDLYGLIVWSEMPSCYDFDDVMVENTKREWKEIVHEHYNHPSILVWTPCNESWGVPGIIHNEEQHLFLDGMYDLTKEMDKTRLVVSNDGWEHCKTDLVTLHNYIQDPEKLQKEFIDPLMDIIKTNRTLYIDQPFVPFSDGYHYEGQPILLDEFCGIGFNVDRINNGWGYGDQVKNEEEFLKRYNGLIKAATKCESLAGWCMTQITDVYQEVNGLFTFERKSKFDLNRIKEINEQDR